MDREFQKNTTKAGGFMVKRIVHLVLAIAVLLSVSACAVGNNEGNNRAGRDNNGTDMRRLTQENTDNVTYRDGVYIGYSDAHANGKEAATVVIRNGKIADIDLTNVRQQGGANNPADTQRNNQTGTGTGTGTTTPGTTGDGTTDNTTQPDMGNRIGTGTGITGGAAADTINEVRTRLVSIMIRDQRYDVTIDNNDAGLDSTIDNWKLAVRRALDQAR